MSSAIYISYIIEDTILLFVAFGIGVQGKGARIGERRMDRKGGIAEECVVY